MRIFWNYYMFWLSHIVSYSIEFQFISIEILMKNYWKIGYFNQAAPDNDPKINWDPDIVRLLDDDAEIDAVDNGELEDDFFIRANRDRDTKNDNDDEDDGDEEDEEEDNYSNRADEDDDYDDEETSESKSMRDLERRSRFSEYSMSSSVVPRNETLKMLDEHFESFYAQYDEEKIGALDTEDIDGFRSRDDVVLNAALEEFSKIIEKKGLVTDKGITILFIEF